MKFQLTPSLPLAPSGTDKPGNVCPCPHTNIDSSDYEAVPGGYKADGAMSFAAKENSINVADANAHRKLSHLGNERSKKPALEDGKPRLALGAKHINTGSYISSGSPIQRKRTCSTGDRTGAPLEVKKPKLYEVADDYIDDNEQTDEDEDQQQSLRNRSSTPLPEISAQRSWSRRKSFYPRHSLTAMADLDVDVPASHALSPIPDDGEDILRGFDFDARPRFKPLRYIPRLIEEVEANMKVGLDDFPDLEIDEGSDCSNNGLETPTSEIRRRNE